MDRRSDPLVRTLVDADLPAALALSHAAGWNQTPDDWQRLLTLEPKGCFGVDDDGRLVATATLLCHGRELAWLGMVLTDAGHQRRGYARALCEACVRLADRRGMKSVKLDATDQGRPLYASLGFRDEQPIERWHRETAPATTSALSIPWDAVLDIEAFGADRSRFLAALGFAMHRPGTRAHYLGPWVARDPGEARDAIGAVVNSIAEPWFWDLLPRHEHATALAKSLGFAPARRLTRMVRGGEIANNDALVYAIGGFEAG